MTFVRTDAFVRDFQDLSNDLQRRAEEALRRFASDPRHPSLRVKKMEPKSRGIFELRVTKSCRITFETGHNDVRLRRIGAHNILRTP